MSFRLALVNLYFRYIEQPYLARVQDYDLLNERTDRQAARLSEPAGTHVNPVRIPTLTGCLDGVWISNGQARRDKVILLLHGGAYVFGSSRSHRPLAAALAHRTKARVLVPDYRLAPDNPFPAAIDDALACYRHLLEIGHAPQDIALLGDSAGGGLAMALLHLCGTTDLPYPCCAVGFSPWTDLTLSGESHTRNARREVMLPASRVAEARDAYLGTTTPTDPRASPVNGTFDGAPPVLLQASRAEILEDDTRAMAVTLSAQGVDVQVDYWEKTPHCWQHLHAHLPEADEALNAASAFLRYHLDVEPLETA
ncbi:Acetyl esterase/lipase [Monaibacterium marinum]|uniref:Acetyl esterase/lipase n=1 Tax=Pontivivens marinum TaxID=1690039 RepID=A0A2C9CP10_9RHOB|nr:alpha/beta hydrolase [Monaibacterium marinum]SOH92925.1 Acetyl esterase/lipase [Monaibacterium marinum]